MPFNTILFDRLVAATRVTGTAVFVIYVADSLGYTGSVVVQLGRDILVGSTSRLDFFVAFTYAMSAGAVLLLVLSAAYFACVLAAEPDARSNP